MQRESNNQQIEARHEFILQQRSSLILFSFTYKDNISDI